METENQKIRKQLRDSYKKKRSLLPPELAKQYSDQICRAVLQWDVYKQAEVLFFYYPLGKEASLLPVIEDALADSRPAAFPKVEEGRMNFYYIVSLDELAEGCYHIMEPQTAGRQPADWARALCFVPGTVFDRAGGRFGYGGGYYDRYFSDRKGCTLAGCAYECQIVQKLPAEAWDQRMDYLISEKGILEPAQQTAIALL